MFGWYQNCFYLCTRFSEVKYSGCSAVRLAHLLWEQGVVGSNPATPTKEKDFDNQWFDAVFKVFFIMKIFILLIKKKEFLPINGHKNLSKTYPLILISMATLKLTIFKAKVLKDGRHKIRVAVCHKQETCYIITRFIIDNLGQRIFRVGKLSFKRIA